MMALVRWMAKGLQVAILKVFMKVFGVTREELLECECHHCKATQHWRGRTGR